MPGVEHDTLKTAFRQVCDVMLENGLDLEKGIKIGIARRVVDDIGKWVESVKKALLVFEHN